MEADKSMLIHVTFTSVARGKLHGSVCDPTAINIFGNSGYGKRCLSVSIM